MLEFLKDLLEFFATNHMVLGVCSLLGIIGFFITIFTWLRTAKISKILKYNSLTSLYNKERQSFQKTFEGHRISIVQDGNRTDGLLKDILKNVEAYHVKFKEILSLKERITLWCFKRILRKSAKDVDFNNICNHLAELAGRLSKKEVTKNGG